MGNHSVSVIIPCYNGMRFLAEAIESVFAQTHQDFEIIAIDDGSTDGTKDIISRYPSIRYVYQQNRGVAVARNTGLQAAQGEYLVFLDQDDRLLPHAFETGIHYLNQHPECGFVFGFCSGIDAESKPLNTAPHHPIDNATYQTFLSGTALVPPSTGIFRRTVFNAVGGFTPVMAPADDYDLYLRITREFPVYCYNQVIVEYRQHGNNQSGSPKRTLETTLRALDAQKAFINNQPELLKAYKFGREHWKKLFGPPLAYEIISQLKAKRFTQAIQAALFTLKHYPQSFLICGGELLPKVVEQFNHKLTGSSS